MFTGPLLRPSSVEYLRTPAHGSSYGAGWVIDRVGAHPRIWHNGGVPGGYASHVSWYPDDKLTIVLLANTDAPAPIDALAATLARAVLREEEAHGAVGRPQVRHRLVARVGEAVLDDQLGHGARGAYQLRGADRDHELLGAGVDPQRLVAHGVIGQANHARELGARGSDRLRRGRLRGLELPRVAGRDDRHDAGLHLERPAVGAAQRAHDVGRAESGMTGERHLETRRENSYVRGRAFARQHERRLAEVELPRERLHLLG